MSSTTKFRRSFFYRVKMSLRGCRPKLSLSLCSFEDEYCLDLFGFLIALPFLDRFHSPPEEIMDKWGAYWYDMSCFVLCWGNKSKHIHMPWAWDHCVHEVLREDGTWCPYIGSWEEGGSDHRKVETAPYRYVLKSGQVQHRIATFHTDRRTWKWKWFKALPYPRLRRTCIDVGFDDEVGERTGSWKGGTIGCGYELRTGETPLACLRRMEAERKF